MMEELSNENNNNDLNNISGSSKSVKKNYIYNLLFQIFLMIVPLVTTPYVSRVLTPEGIGQYSFSSSILLYFTLFGSLGFGYYAQREISKYQNDIKKQSIVFWEINICKCIPVSIAVLINVLLFSMGVYKEYNTIMQIFTINIFAIILDISFFFQGNENFKSLVIRNVIVKVLSVASIFIFVKAQGDLWVYTLINALSVLFSNIIMIFSLRKYLVKVNLRDLRPLKHMPGTILLFLPTIAVSIYTVLDKTLIGLLIQEQYTVIGENGEEIVKKYSDLENGYYEQSEKIVKLAMTVITALGTVMIPRNSHELSIGNIEGVRNNLKNSALYVLFIGVPLMLGLIVVSPNFVPWFFGEEYNKCIVLMRILSPLIIIIGFSHVLGLQYLVPSGNDKKFTIAMIVGAVSNLLLNLIMIRFWWSIGAAIATIAAELLVTVTMAFMVRKEVNLLKILVEGWKYYIAGGLMFVVCYFIGRNFSPSIVHTLIIVSVGVVIYFITLLLLREKLLCVFLKKALNKIKKNTVA